MTFEVQYFMKSDNLMKSNGFFFNDFSYYVIIQKKLNTGLCTIMYNIIFYTQ